MVKSRLARGAVAAVALALFVATANAQGFRRGGRGGRFFGELRRPTPTSFDGSFTFCRIMFPFASDGDGGGWQVDYPRADINLSIRLSELTKTRISRQADGEPNHLVMELTDPAIFNCPFIMMTEVGAAYIGPAEAKNLREYLLKGGFLWADDFWGEYAWAIWESQIRKALPSSNYPIVDLPLDHPIFRQLQLVDHVPQIPGFGGGAFGSTSERGADSAVPHVRAILDDHQRVMVLITFNTDFGDSYEREDQDPNYFQRFSVIGYAFGINALLYSMVH